MSGRWVLAVALVMVGLPLAALAEGLPRVEITPFFGYRFGGGLEDAETGEDFELDDSAYSGGLLDLRLGEATQLELYYSRQETELQSEEGLFYARTLCDLDIEYYHVGGTYVFTEGPWQPFVVGTVGATHIDPDATGSDSLTRFSLGLGGGVRFFPTPHLGLYLAGRCLFTFLEGEVIAHSESGSTTVTVDSSGLWQAELQAGAIFAF